MSEKKYGKSITETETKIRALLQAGKLIKVKVSAEMLLLGDNISQEDCDYLKKRYQTFFLCSNARLYGKVENEYQYLAENIFTTLESFIWLSDVFGSEIGFWEREEDLV